MSRRLLTSTQTATNYLEIAAADVIVPIVAMRSWSKTGRTANQRVKCLDIRELYDPGGAERLTARPLPATTGPISFHIIDVKRASDSRGWARDSSKVFTVRDTVPIANALSSLQTVDLEVDDLIEMLVYRRGRLQAGNRHDIGGENSFISIVQNGAAGAKGDTGESRAKTALLTCPGWTLKSSTEADKGTVWLDTYQHDMSFAVRRFRATTEATGTGTAVTDIDFTQNDRPRPTASGEVWFKPANDNVYISGTGNIWFSTQWRFASVSTALSLPYTGYTSVEYIGQYDTADDAANSIPAADYAATVQYIFYDRDDARNQIPLGLRSAGNAGRILGYRARPDR